ncbi:hypothetical protein [Nocardioides alkalitolerans]|uniref:hypothetical protein n=1 Tax=Nocardioides alkalitolerans TaxID=281714 RepID=UPI00041626F9|nr:hypothetical protein [Nocardioides alkalitolerans]
MPSSPAPAVPTPSFSAGLRHALAALFAMVVLVAGIALVTTTDATPRADAATSSSAAAAGKGILRGTIRQSNGQIYNRPVKVTLFTQDWTYIGATTVTTGYKFTVTEGLYRIQVTDTRPTYDTNRFAPTDVSTGVEAGNTRVRDAVMRRGASITGTVTTGRVTGSNARVVASNQYGQSYETRANSAGQFAIGGLPTANYSLFTYDARGQWADTSMWLPNRKIGSNTNVAVVLRRAAGALTIDLYGGNSPLAGSATLTATNRTTGQWYTAKASGGSVTFAGIMPGPYTLSVPDMGNYLGRSGPVASGRHVPTGDILYTSFQLTQRGGSVTGFAVDDRVSNRRLPSVQVKLYDKYGTLKGSTWTSPSGLFTINGALRSDSGYVLILQKPDGGYVKWGPGGNDTCSYSMRRAGTFSIRQGTVVNVGGIGMRAVAPENNPNCVPAAPTTPPTTTPPTTPPTSTPTTPPATSSPSASPSTAPTTPAPTSSPSASPSSSPTATVTVTVTATP